jgi:hypothetical protein
MSSVYNHKASFFIAVCTGGLYGMTMAITSGFTGCCVHIFLIIKFFFFIGIILEKPWASYSSGILGFLSIAVLIGATIGFGYFSFFFNMYKILHTSIK